MIGFDAIPLQIGKELTVFTVGIGLTVIVNVCAVPKQSSPLKVNFGVTVMVLTIGFGVVLETVKDGILPTPAALIVTAVFELIQSKTVLGTLPVKSMFPVEAPEQSTSDCIGFTVGIGLTVILIMSVA